MRKLFYFLVVVLFIGITPAMSQFSISAELRPRFEIDNGTYSPLHDTASTLYYVSQRTRLNLDYNNEKFQMQLSVQDVRIWGSEDIASPTGVYGSTTGLDIHEAWFRMKAGNRSEFTIGRQSISLDDQRLVAIRNWNQYGVSYDALRYKYSYNDWTLNFLASYNNTFQNKVGVPLEDETIFNSTNRMKSFSFVHLRKKFSEHISASAIAIGSGFQKLNDQHIMYLTGTYGLWAGINAAGFDANASIYYQNGAAQNGKEVNAYMFTLNPGYTISKFRIGFGADYFSGDDANNSEYMTSERTFNRFYGAVYKYNGNMNYYTYIKGSTRNGGLLDLYPNLTYKPANKHMVSAYYHLFSLANSVMVGNEVIDHKKLGSEIDVIYTFKQSQELELKAGFSYYFATETLERIKGMGTGNAQPAYWAWVMLTFNPTLFTSK